MASCPMSMKRPQHYPYSFKALLDLPRRITNPPPVEGKVRSFSVIPEIQIRLVDVLDNRHLPPLTLKDFEEFLLFHEYSAENLYFLVWFRDYSKLYEGLSQPGSNVGTGDLAISFSQAVSTFIVPASSYELNLSSQAKSSVLDVAKTCSHPAPSALDQAVHEVKGMLEQSLARFVRMSSDNAQWQRKIFSVSGGISTIAIGLAPVLVSILEGKSRWVRLAAWPFFWLGATVLVAALNGICMIIYVFGDARQLYPFELAMPNLVVSAPVDEPGADGLVKAIEKENPFRDDVESQAGSVKAITTAGFIKDFQQLNQPPILDKELPLTPISPSTTVFTLDFDFSALPPLPYKRSSTMTGSESFSHSSFSSVPTFGSLTKVVSPVVSRIQWEIVFRSGLLSFAIATILQVIVLVIPPRR